MVPERHPFTLRSNAAHPRATLEPCMTLIKPALLVVICLSTSITQAAPVLAPGFDPETVPGTLVTRLVLIPGGGIVLAGSFPAGASRAEAGVLRLHPSGDLDDSFEPAGANGPIEALLPAPDGSLYLGGRFSEIANFETHGIARLGANGGIDSDFQVAPGTSGAVRALALREDGLLAGGSFGRLGGAAANYLSLVGLVDGGPDTAWASGVERSMALEGGIDCLAVQPDGKILVGGTFNTEAGPRQLVRLNVDGSLDSSFHGDHGPMLYPARIHVEEDGSILVAGLASADNTGFVRRLLPNGTSDPAFDAPGFQGMVHDFCVDAEGRIIAAGKPAGSPGHGAVRLLPDGTLDPGWEVVTDGPILALASHMSEGVLAGGAFSEIQGAPRNGLALLRDSNQPAFHGASTAGGGGFLTFLQAQPGFTYVVESSTDLSSWNTFSTNLATNAGLEILDENAASQPRRFFRARLVTE